jgi:thymidylate kinase
MAKHYPHRICLIDASQSLVDVQKQIKLQLLEYDIPHKEESVTI